MSSNSQNITAAVEIAFTNHSSWYALRWVCLILEILIFVIAAPLTILKRNTPIIYFRCWSLNIFTVFLVITYKTMETVAGTPGMGSVDLMSHLMLPKDIVYVCGIFPTYLATFFRHHFLSRRPIIQQKLASTHVNDVKEYQRLTRRLQWNKFLYSDIMIWAYWGIHFLVSASICLAFYSEFNIEDALLKGGTANRYQLVITVISVLEVIIILGCFFLLVPIKRSDNYNITLQLQALVIITTIGLILQVISTVFSQAPGMKLVYQLNANVTPMVLCFLDLVLPVLPSKTYRQVSRDPIKQSVSQIGRFSSSRISRVSTTPSTKKQNDLNSILENEAILDKFKDFMAKEFCLENILFIIAVENQRAVMMSSASATEKLKVTEQVIENYICPGAPSELNLPSAEVRTILDHFAEYKKLSGEGSSKVGDLEILNGLFDTAEQHVRLLITCNNLARFLKTCP